MPKTLQKTIFIFAYLLSFFLAAETQSIENIANEINSKILLNFKRFTVDEGLSQNTVTSFVKDKQGYVWIGTINGLNRFDGKEFKQYFANESNNLPSSFIRNLIVDDDGEILIGTDNGLVKFDEKNEGFITLYNSEIINNQTIWSLDIYKNNIYIGLHNSLVALNLKSGEFDVKVKNDKLREIKKTIGTEKGIYIRNYEGDIFYLKNNSISKIDSETIDITKIGNKLLISKENNSYYISEDETKVNINISLGKFNENLLKNKVSSTHNNIIYNITSEKGAIKIIKQGIIDPKLYNLNKSIFIHTENEIFASDFNSGFILIKDDYNYFKKTVINLKNIWSISKNNSKMLVASDGNEIIEFDSNFNVTNKFPTSFTLGPKFIASSQNYMAIGSKDGLEIINLKTKKSITISKYHITHVKFEEDNSITVGTFNGDIISFTKEGTLIESFFSSKKYPIYDTLKINNDIWIASQAGLIRKSKQKIELIYGKELVLSLLDDGENVLFGTRGSLLKAKKNSNDIHTIFNHNKIIYSIIKNDNLIITSSSGEVNILNTEDNSLKTFTSENGIFNDYNIKSSLQFNGKIILGSPDGLSIISPDNVLLSIKNKPAAEVIFQDVYLFNSPLKVGSGVLNENINTVKSLVLKYSDYPLSIKFSTLIEDPSNYEFYYSLKGLDAEWLQSKGINSATYTNLSPGEYIFEVYAKSKVSNIKTDKKSIHLTITPPWWLSLRAKCVYALTFIIIMGLIIRAVLRRREIQKQIALSEERLKLSLWGSGDEMWDWDIESGKIFRSNIWGTLDFPQDGRRSGKIGEESNIHPIDQPRVQKALNDHFSNITDHFEIAYRVKGRNNQWMWILDRAKIVERDQKDHPVRMTGTIKDINNIKQVEEQLKLFARAIENISEGMFILNQDYVFVEVNEACCEIASCSRDNFMQQKLAFTRYPESYSEQIRTALRQQGRWSGEIEAKKGDNNFFLMELTIDAIYNEQGETSHYVGVFSDITRRKQQEEELRKLTNNDLLTGLPNRSSLQVTLNNLVKKDIHHTLMVLDLDNFKRINDSLGHQVGDELLISVAERIKKAIPSHASLYRLGGDEFALLIDQNPDIGSSAMIASNIIQSLKPAFDLNDESLVLGISIGVVLYPEDEQNEQALLRKADIAMYHAKSAGGNRYQFYSESLNQNALRQLEVENLIREALKEDYFEVYYQPKVDLKSDCLAGMEALVRLNHPKHGIIPPNDFIPLAEENGLIVEIGDVVLRKACFAANKWLEQGLFNGRVAVNLSSRQFALTDLQQRIESILRLTKLPAKHLELEITEGTVIKNPEKAIKVMQQLAKMGVSLALDDFGTGYSSLSYLKRFPINCLKIDKSFVDDIDKSDRDLKMVDSIITIAHNMGLTVVGEGVEQNAQLNILKALNCEEIQGYIFSKPVPEKDFEQLLATDQDKRTQFKTQKPNKN
ncbi:EAL domain-containing protein [Shewanella holmiensis]|uniref:cyclic-guanylate-specific phosphodiesterase n=1 Tax=Shewanella holmiensis TaxID=2952222 RepID=A0A9X3AR18_9GAMM|nr:EAL domain-containing protein [Shewanella holmiensis]MCT7943141.1 EAL domain-containing protein [Shewanella holmiensis]